MTNEIIVEGQDTERAEEVRIEIDRVKGHLQEGIFDLADLLSEARRKAFHVNWGYANFGHWIEEGSGLDISERSAFYLIKIVDTGKELGIPKAQLRAVKMSKLKEIFTLDKEKHGDSIRELVGQGQHLPLSEIRDKIGALKEKDGIQPFIYMTLKMPKSVKEETVDQAFELVRRQYGDSKDDQGNIIDLTEGKCLEFVCQSYVQDPNNQGEQQ